MLRYGNDKGQLSGVVLRSRGIEGASKAGERADGRRIEEWRVGRVCRVAGRTGVEKVKKAVLKVGT